MEQEASGIFYERFFPQVWAYAVGRIGRQPAEDAVAETFAVAWRRRAISRPIRGRGGWPSRAT